MKQTETSLKQAGTPQTEPSQKSCKPVLTQKGEKHDLNSPECYLNRELTWLEFNKRILSEARDERNPLLERVFFMAVVHSNFDEFFMKRIGGLKQQVGAGVKELTIDGLLPQEQIDACHIVVQGIVEQLNQIEQELKQLLAAKNIKILAYTELNAAQKKKADTFFHDRVYPLLTPQGMDPAHPFPFISNLSINLLVVTRYPENEHTYFNRIKIPISDKLPRFINIDESKKNFIVLDDLVQNNLKQLFPGMVIDSCSRFRVTRNAITEKALEGVNDLLNMIETALRDRKFAEVVRLEIGSEMSEAHRGILASHLKIDEEKDVVTIPGIIGGRDSFQIAALDLPQHHFPTHHPVDNAELLDKKLSIFHIIRAHGNILLQHPYESFDTSVERFLYEASVDPKVLAIKMTLYRTAKKSRIIQYLIDAAQNGKQVAVVVELKARFDESANIQWANYLEEVGIHVTYGVVDLKTHSKLIFVIRDDYDHLRRYAHIGTGNYHAGTARAYCDLGMLTCDPEIGEDLTELFNYLTTGCTPFRHYHKLLPSPKLLKKGLLDRIEREIRLHSAEHPGHIQMKTNALEDSDIIAALYKASQAGVVIDLIVRDTCRLRPGIPGLSDTIRVISIVGRFLEHTRIFYFKNNGQEEYFIGSADLMKRNLESRVEVCTPVFTPKLQSQLREILDLQMANTRNVWDMQPDGTYVQRRSQEKNGNVSLHDILIDRARQRHSEGNRALAKKSGKKK
jgi:polyphosphate kinase